MWKSIYRGRFDPERVVWVHEFRILTPQERNLETFNENVSGMIKEVAKRARK